MKTSFSYPRSSRDPLKRPAGSSPSSYPDSSTRIPATLTVVWESAMPVLKARKAVRQPTMATPYTISISGVPRALTANPTFHPRSIQDQATLKSGRRTIKATSADIIPTGNSLLIVLQFPTDIAIAPTDPEVRFRVFILTSEITAKFQPPLMLHEGQLRL